MKLELVLPCSTCGEGERGTVPMMSAWWEWNCAVCGHHNELLGSEKWSVGWRVLEKAKGEYLDDTDYSTSIVFAAMAVDVELARLYFKWRRIDFLRRGLKPPGDEQLDGEYRSLGDVSRKIDAVSRLLVNESIDDFARRTELAERIESGYPSLSLGSLSKDVQRAVFWPRNRVLHAGYFDHTREDAKRITNVASMILDLLKQMDLARRS